MAFLYMLILIVGIQGLNGGIHSSLAVKLVGIVVMLFAALGITWSLFGLSQMAVYTSAEGVVVKNWLRRIFIPWEDIREFRFGNLIDDLSVREHLNSPYLQSYVILKDGRHVVMSGLMLIRIRRAESRRRVQLLLNGLEEERFAHLGGRQTNTQ